MRGLDFKVIYQVVQNKKFLISYSEYLSVFSASRSLDANLFSTFTDANEELLRFYRSPNAPKGHYVL